MQKPIEVVAAVIRDGDTLLACRRAADRSAGGKWEFPGGKVDPGEAPAEALTREIAEELGVEVRVGALLDRTVTVVGEARIDLACYETRLAGARPDRSTDHDELRWVGVGDLAALDWAAPDLPVVRLLTA
ncbi:(deoxy)nucleoside triphosphate pyrophosphohydrolase [Salinibacterium sp. ZJ454]|uniref:(deoxy)nucleoside triphosphate pyrophosphohydrolase n=1 Tax=Salinibacterium sp. ZJ454 TaxID=2708339 RepID=UPI00141FE624|nr:(deoxy)nucleoside triphosphate pyrophosphohydrolase [Salinibacterium sp. ZJ454]